MCSIDLIQNWDLSHTFKTLNSNCKIKMLSHISGIRLYQGPNDTEISLWSTERLSQSEFHTEIWFIQPELLHVQFIIATWKCDLMLHTFWSLRFKYFPSLIKLMHFCLAIKRFTDQNHVIWVRSLNFFGLPNPSSHTRAWLNL
jgi:hypothetical protein